MDINALFHFVSKRRMLLKSFQQSRPLFSKHELNVVVLVYIIEISFFSDSFPGSVIYISDGKT